MDGFVALCAVLGKIRTVRLADCGLGPSSAAELSKIFSDATAEIVSVNCLANQFGEEGLATLLTAIEGTSVRSLCGLTEGQTTVDFSGQNLSPIDCKILAAEYGFRGFIAAVESIDLSGCGLTGATKNYRGRWENICLLYTSPSPRDYAASRMPSSA